MQRDSARLFGTTVVITAAIIGGMFLLDRATKTGRPLPPEQATWTELKPSSQPSRSEGVGSSAAAQNHVSAETSAEGIIVCQHPEHGTVYTNAASCDEVDYDNRLSQAEPFQPVENPERYRHDDYQSPNRQAANSSSNTPNPAPKNVCDKTSLRLHARTPPNGLNQSCKFAVGKAFEIERSLAVADDPAESTWLESYCKWAGESFAEECDLSEVTYCFTNHCPGWYRR